MKRRILIAADGFTRADDFRSVLERAGYEIEFAPDAETAVKRVRVRRPDLIIVDATMSGTSGLDLCKDLKSLPATESAPVVVVTGTGSAEVAEGLASGADNVIFGPFEENYLRDRIERIFASLRAHDRSEPEATAALSERSGAIVFRADQRQILELLLSTSDKLRSMSEDLSGTREALNRALKKLRKGDAVLQSIVDQSRAAVSVKDPQGRYLLVNRRFQALFGIDHGEALSKTDRDLFPRVLADRFRANDVEVMRSGRPVEAEEILLSEDGSCTFVSLRFPILTDSGETVAVGVISIDSTRRKNTEREPRRNGDEAERTNTTKSEFLSDMMHEMCAPLTAVLGFAQLLEGEDLAPEQRESVEQILKAARRLLDLTDGVLDVSGIETDRLSLAM